MRFSEQPHLLTDRIVFLGAFKNQPHGAREVVDTRYPSVLDAGANDFVSVDDCVVPPCIHLLASLEPPLIAGESAVAGLGAIVAAASRPELRAALGLTDASRVAIIICEGPPGANAS